MDRVPPTHLPEVKKFLFRLENLLLSPLYLFLVEFLQATFFPLLGTVSSFLLLRLRDRR